MFSPLDNFTMETNLSETFIFRFARDVSDEVRLIVGKLFGKLAETT